MARVLLVDGLNLVRRIYEARGGAAGDEFIEACKLSLQRCLRDVQPSHGVVVWDSTEPTWRHLLDSAYKANRSPTPQTLVESLPMLTAAFKQLSVESLTIENYEADDVIATMAATLASAGSHATIVSTDKMFYPLLSQFVSIYHQFDRKLVDIDSVQTKFGLSISQLIDYWALSGDNSNNIKGVPGIGKKTATALLQEHGSLENMLVDRTVSKVADHEDDARRCRQLVELKSDVELGINLRSFRLN